MKRLALIGLMVFALAISIGTVNAAGRDSCPSVKQTLELSHRVWAKTNAMRGAPTAKVVKHYRSVLRCSGPSARHVIRRGWVKDKKQFFHYRAKLKRLYIDYTWPGAVYPESAWFSLAQLKPYVAAALAEAAGEYAGTDMPGWTMVEISQGEGDLKPGSRSTDDGWGWLAVTAPYADSLGVSELGGYEEMLNPVKNAYVAARIYGYQGLSAWYGDSHVTDPDRHYTGKFDIRDALGGLTFGQALRRSKTL